MQQATQSQASPQGNLELWVSYLEIERGLLPNTIRLYRRTMERLERELPDVSNLETEDLRTWLHSRRSSSASFGNRLCALRSYYRWLVRTKRRKDDPTIGIDAPKRRKGLPKPVKNLPAVLKALDEVDRKANLWGAEERPVGQSRWMAVFLAETGLRIHEAVALNVPVPCGDQLEVLGKGAKLAIIPLTPEAREALNNLGGKWPIGARATQRRFEKVGFHPHQLRHTLGCTLAAAGCDLGEIQDLLRHSSPATTRTYAAYSMDRLRAAQARKGGVHL